MRSRCTLVAVGIIGDAVAAGGMGLGIGIDGGGLFSLATTSPGFGFFLGVFCALFQTTVVVVVLLGF